MTPAPTRASHTAYSRRDAHACGPNRTRCHEGYQLTGVTFRLISDVVVQIDVQPVPILKSAEANGVSPRTPRTVLDSTSELAQHGVVQDQVEMTVQTGFNPVVVGSGADALSFVFAVCSGRRKRPSWTMLIGPPCRDQQARTLIGAARGGVAVRRGTRRRVRRGSCAPALGGRKRAPSRVTHHPAAQRRLSSFT